MTPLGRRPLWLLLAFMVSPSHSSFPFTYNSTSTSSYLYLDFHFHFHFQLHLRLLFWVFWLGSHFRTYWQGVCVGCAAIYAAVKCNPAWFLLAANTHVTPSPSAPPTLCFSGNCIEHINQLNCIFMRQVWPTNPPGLVRAPACKWKLK